MVQTIHDEANDCRDIGEICALGRACTLNELVLTIGQALGGATSRSASYRLGRCGERFWHANCLYRPLLKDLPSFVAASLGSRSFEAEHRRNWNRISRWTSMRGGVGTSKWYEENGYLEQPMSKHAQQAAARFDSWADSYGEDRISPWFHHYQSLALSQLDLGKGSFLDVGCGVGRAVRDAAQHLKPGKRACGIDISPKMIEKAQGLAKGLTSVEFQVANAEQIPYSDASFDSILCTCSFHHYENPTAALREIRRVLSKEGKFALLDSARDVSFPIWVQDRFRRYLEKSHVRYYSTKEIQAMLSETGWTVAGNLHRIKRFMDHRKVFTGLFLVACTK